jgi:outer membrane immunogenic protein
MSNIARNRGLSQVKRVLLSGVALAAISVAVVGPAKAAPPPPIPFNWSGFYVGGHIGYGNSRFNFNTTTSPPNTRDDSPVGGVQLGYNWQMGNIVWGLEGDASAVGFLGGHSDYAELDADFISSIRGRLGYAFNRILIYGTAGGALVHERGMGSNFTRLSFNKFTGVAGGGVEYAVTKDFSVRAEALDYFGAGSVSLGGDDTGQLKNVVVGRLGVNWLYCGDGCVDPKKKPMSANYDWSGVYVGGHIGFAEGKFNFNSNGGGSYPMNMYDTTPAGGLQLGYNWQRGNIVWGAEGDATAAGLWGGTFDYAEMKVDFMSSIRGRLGYSFGRVLFYGTGGGALIHERSYSSSSIRQTHNKFTPVVGGGIEYAVTDHLSARAEVLDYFGTGIVSAGDDTGELKNILVERVGVNWHF